MNSFKKILGGTVLSAVAFLGMANAKADEFDKVLTDGKLVINSIEPTNMSEFQALVVMPLYEEYEGEYGFKYDDENHKTMCNDTFTKCTMEYSDGDWSKPRPTKEVEIVYNYDKNAKTVIDKLLTNLPEDGDSYTLTDTEFLSYLINKSENSKLSDFSGALNKTLSYKNISFRFAIGAGDDAPFYTENRGEASVVYNDTVYHVISFVGVAAPHVIYVPDDTTDIKAAIEKRIKDAFGNVDIKVEEAGVTVTEFLAEEKEGYKNYYNLYSAHDSFFDKWASAEEYATEKMNELYYDEDGIYHFITEIEEEGYILTINDEEYGFGVIKDSSKINNNLTYASSDTLSDIMVSANSNSIPLDTHIKTIKLTSGDEYNKIIKLVDVKTSETYDISLYSASLKDYITKLENGKFEVRIPISDELKDKELKVYYVDENDKVVEYEVTVKDGYAIFTTDHFSIYTLGGVAKNSNPKTGDNYTLLMIILGISIIGLLGGTLYMKKKKVVKNN